MIICIYNKLFFIEIYKYMHDKGIDRAFDQSNTLWFKDDVNQLLVKVYGYVPVN